jgi:hypothetical protein
VPAPPDPAAERALSALKQRLLALGPARSLIAAVQHREQRRQRQQAAAKVQSLQATLVQASAPTPPPAAPTTPAAGPIPPSAGATDGVAADRDARELEPWFRELPAREQHRLRAVWWEERHRHDHAWIGHRRRLQRAASYGAMVLGGLGLLQSLLVGGFHTVLPLAIAGAFAALVAEAVGGGRFAYAGLGPIAWFVVMGPTLMANPFAMYGVLMAAYGFGAIGMDGEMRRSAGFVDQQPPPAPVTAPAPVPVGARPAAAPTAVAPAVRR